MPNDIISQVELPDGTVYDVKDDISGYSKVAFSRAVSTGTQIGSITIDGTTTVIYAPSGGGGGSTSTVLATTVTLDSSDWSNNSQTVSVQGVTTTNAVIVTAASAYVSTWSSCQIACTGQSSGALTFSCSTAPSGDVDANILIITDLALLTDVLYRVSNS